MKLNETSLFEGYNTEIRKDNLTVTALQMELLFKSFFEGIAEYLGNVKVPDKTRGIKITDYKKNFLIGAYISYDGQTSGEEKGAWEMDVTFNESDIPADAEIVDMKESETYFAFKKAGIANGFKFAVESDMLSLSTPIPMTIKNWLDQNAKENEEVSVTLDGVFEASVNVENGEKIFGITIMEEVKDIAKGDRILSEVEVK